MSTKVALIGAGGHAVSLTSMMLKGIDVVGYVNFAPSDTLALPWLGSDAEFLEHHPDMPVHIAVVMGRNGDLSLRRRIINMYKHCQMPVLVAESALVTPLSKIGRGSAVMHRAVVNGASVGEMNVVNTGAIVEHGVTTGSNVFIGPGAVVCGGVTIGSDVMIGAGAVIRNNVTVCSGCVIGMGSVVTKDIDQNGVYVGNPCKKLCQEPS